MDEYPYERKPSPMDDLFKAIKAAKPHKSNKLEALLEETDPKELSKNDPESGYTPITWAADRGYVHGLVLMLEHKGDPNARNKYDDSPLYCALHGKKADAVKSLLEHKADALNCGSDTCIPLLYAVQHCSAPIVEMLLEAGLDPDIMHEKLTPRQYAANSLKHYPTERRWMDMAAAFEIYPAK